MKLNQARVRPPLSVAVLGGSQILASRHSLASIAQSVSAWICFASEQAREPPLDGDRCKHITSIQIHDLSHGSTDTMGRKRTVFTSTQDRAVAMNIKVPPETKSRIDNLKDALRKVDDGLVFNVSKICGDALLAAVKQGEKELSGMRPAAAAKISLASGSATKA